MMGLALRVTAWPIARNAGGSCQMKSKLNNGDCSKCRKRNYCKKQCRANKMFNERIMHDAFRAALRKRGIPTPEQMTGEVKWDG